jgi:hypothetical protein
MLKKPASFVLGSSKSSTYPRGYASGFDSSAALLDELFEQPVRCSLVVLYAWVIESHCAAIVVPQPANRLKPVENQV